MFILLVALSLKSTTRGVSIKYYIVLHSFFVKFYYSQMSYLGQRCQAKLGVTDFVSEIKRVENYPDFENLAHAIQHGLQRFIVKNIEGKSKEANDLHNRLVSNCAVTKEQSRGSGE